jgi:hypothetical protein
MFLSFFAAMSIAKDLVRFAGMGKSGSVDPRTQGIAKLIVIQNPEVETLMNM